jgi:hypothetical protein
MSAAMTGVLYIFYRHGISEKYQRALASTKDFPSLLNLGLWHLVEFFRCSFPTPLKSMHPLGQAWIKSYASPKSQSIFDAIYIHCLEGNFRRAVCSC